MAKKTGPSEEDLIRLRATLPNIYGFIHSPTEVPKDATPVVSVEDYVPEKYAQYVAEGRARANIFDEGLADGSTDVEYVRATLRGRKSTEAIVFTGSAKTLWGQWQEIARSLPNGPHYMDGRDGTLTIHNRKTERPTSFVYTYAGGNGELLFFSVQSKMGTQAVDAAQSTDIDGDEKELTVDLVQNYTGANTGLYIYEHNAKIPEIGPQIDKTRVEVNDQRERMFKYLSYGPGGYGPPQKTEMPFSEVEPLKTFASEKEAVQYYRDGAFTGAIEFTPEEATRLNQQLVELITSQNEIPKTLEDLDNLIHINDPNTFYITRTVRIRQTLDPYEYGSREAMMRPGGPTSSYYNQSRSRVNQRRIGEKYIRDNYTVVGYKQHKLGEEGYIEWGVDDPYPGEALNTLPDGVEVQGKQYNTSTKLFIVETVQDVTIPLNIIHIFGGVLPIGGLTEALDNDTTGNRENQVKAKATIVGRPAIESSMNLLIQNVSSKYSGVWYTKEVTHKINSSVGYQCEIEFVQRDIPVVKNVVTTTMSTANLAWGLLSDETLREKAKKSFETGNWKIPIKLRAKAKALSQNTKLNVAIVQDNQDPTKATVIMGSQDANQYSGWIETRDKSDISLDIKDLSFSNPAHGLTK